MACHTQALTGLWWITYRDAVIAKMRLTTEKVKYGSHSSIEVKANWRKKKKPYFHNKRSPPKWNKLKIFNLGIIQSISELLTARTTNKNKIINLEQKQHTPLPSPPVGTSSWLTLLCTKSTRMVAASTPISSPHSTPPLPTASTASPSTSVRGCALLPWHHRHHRRCSSSLCKED